MVEAKSVTEAEEKVNKVYTSEGFSSDFEVVLVKRSKVVEIIAPDTKDLKELPEGKWLTRKPESEVEAEEEIETEAKTESND